MYILKYSANFLHKNRGFHYTCVFFFEGVKILHFQWPQYTGKFFFLKVLKFRQKNSELEFSLHTVLYIVNIQYIYYIYQYYTQYYKWYHCIHPCGLNLSSCFFHKILTFISSNIVCEKSLDISLLLLYLDFYNHFSLWHFFHHFNWCSIKCLSQLITFWETPTFDP